MSHHGVVYRVYPDDEAKGYSHAEWVRADRWINGLSAKRDFNEAVALAELGAENCRYPFVIMEVPRGGKRPEKCPAWTVRPKGVRR